MCLNINICKCLKLNKIWVIFTRLKLLWVRERDTNSRGWKLVKFTHFLHESWKWSTMIIMTVLSGYLMPIMMHSLPTQFSLLYIPRFQISQCVGEQSYQRGLYYVFYIYLSLSFCISFKSSLCLNGSRLWNELPLATKKKNTFTAFKYNIKNIWLTIEHLLNSSQGCKNNITVYVNAGPWCSG